MKEAKYKRTLHIFIVAIFFVVMLSPTVSSEEDDSRLLKITIEDSETATVEWRIPYTGEALRYLQVARQILQENIADVEEGNEQLFLQDVQNIELAVYNQTLVITFSLAGNYSGSLITGKYRDLYELGEYSPVGVDVLKVKIPDGKYLSSISPGPNEIVGNELIYYNYNWIYPLEINYSDQLTTTQIGEEWKLPTIKTISVEDVSKENQTQGEVGILGVPTPIPNNDFGINNYSKYLIPGYESYVGTTTVPNTGGKTAYEIASEYKPKLYTDKRTSPPIAVGGPDAGYYRVLKGYDPYAGFDAYLIQYIMYWEYQICLSPHLTHDYEPIFIWVRNIGDRPYRVAYDRWTPLNWHIYDIHRTDLWSDSSGKYDLDDMNPVYTQDKSYYPFGRHLYPADIRNDLWLHDISTTLPDVMWIDNNVMLSHANCYNTFDTEWWFGDPLETYTLQPLDDALLYSRYRSTFDMDISDSFYEVFWEGAVPDAESISVTVNSAIPSGNTLTVDASVSYDHDDPSPYPLKGLHGDRFNAWLDSTLLPLSSITETAAGRYQINYDISSFATGQTYDFTLTVIDNLDLKFSTDTDTVNIPGDSQPPNQPGLSSPSNGATTSDNTPTFTWTEPTDPGGSGIASYRIQVDDDSGFGNPEIDASPVYPTSYTAPFALPDGTYYWHVLAVDNNGNIGDYSGTWSFTVDTSCVDTSDPPAPSSITVPSSDSDGAYTVSWSSVVDNGCSGISYYELKEQGPSGTRYIDTYDTSMDIVVNENGVYTYWARAWDNAGNYGGWSPGGSVTVSIPPADPSVIDGFNTNNGRVTNAGTYWGSWKYKEYGGAYGDIYIESTTSSQEGARAGRAYVPYHPYWVYAGIELRENFDFSGDGYLELYAKKSGPTATVKVTVWHKNFQEMARLKKDVTVQGSYYPIRFSKNEFKGTGSGTIDWSNVNKIRISIYPKSEGASTLTAYFDNFKFSPDEREPDIYSVAESADPVCLAGTGTPSQVTVSATADDTYYGGSKIASATLHYQLPGASWSTAAMGAKDGAFDEIKEAAEATLSSFSTTGSVYYYVTAEDTAGNVETGGQSAFTVEDCTPLNTPPAVYALGQIPTSLSRTQGFKVYAHYTDAETAEVGLAPTIEYQRPANDGWNGCTEFWDSGNHRRYCDVDTTTDDSQLGTWDFRTKVCDSEPLCSDWTYDLDAVTVGNNNPAVAGLDKSTASLYRTQVFTIYLHGSDTEDPESSLTPTIQYRLPGNPGWSGCTGAWDAAYHRWFCTVTTTTADSQLGTWDMRGRFTDTDGGTSAWTTNNDVITVSNNNPLLSGILDVDTDENTSPPDNWIDLHAYASDVEDIASGMGYTIVSETNPSLIDCYIDSNRYVDCAPPATDQYGSSNVTVQVADTDGGTDTDTFTVTVNREYNTPQGTNVFVDLGGGNSVTFSQVDVSGETSDDVTGYNPVDPLPAEYVNVGDYHNITTAAVYTGQVNVTLGYNEAEVLVEDNLKIFHWNGTDWEDVTSDLDTVNNMINGTVTSLSPFVVVEYAGLRPTDPGGGIDGLQHLLPRLYNSTGGNFVLHWTNGTDGGSAADAPDLTDSDSDGTPDFVEDFASYFETSYAFMTGRGFNAPPSDAAEPNDANDRNPDNKYDVFIYNVSRYGYTNAEYPTAPSYSYIGVDNDYAGFPPNQDPDGNTKGTMKITAANTLFQAVQFTYDVAEEKWWVKTTSTYMEDEIFPATNDVYNYLWYWFEFSDAYGLETVDGTHEYENFIFAKRLSEDFGDDIIRAIWEEMSTADGLTAIDNVLVANGSSLIEEFRNFTTANFFLEDMYADGAEYRAAIAGTTFGGVWIEAEYDEAINGIPYTIDIANVNYDAWMDAWAADYITLSMSGGVTGYEIAFDGFDNSVNYDVSLVTKAGGVINTTEFVLDANKEGTMYLLYDPAYTDVVLIIRNSGSVSTTNPTWKVKIKDLFIPPENTVIYTYTNDTDVPIPDNNGWVSSEITVPPGDSGTIKDLLVYVGIDHTFRGDLNLDLISPLGTTVRLYATSGDSSYNIYTWYDNGTVPDGPGVLDDFNGEESGGTWELSAQDTWEGDVGLINTWSIKLYVDIPPVISIASPQNITYTSTSVDLDVSANEDIVTWLYSLNSSANTSFIPNTTITAAEGLNNLTVSANDTDGNVNSSTVYFTVDTTPPAITLSSPLDDSWTNDTTTAFQFIATDNIDASMSCELFVDGTGYGSISAANDTLATITANASLPDGARSWYVNCTDDVQNTGQSAAWTLNVDTNPPDTITSGPPDPSNLPSATFEFISTEPGSTFECELDGGGYSACTSPKNYTNLSNGNHEFNVRATDQAGNTDPTPTNYSWSIDTSLIIPITVCPFGCDHISIQAAVDAADIGDTIKAYAGTYTENVNVNKSLSIVGSGYAITTVKAANSSGSVFYVTADNVNISGFTIKGANGNESAGIVIEGTDNGNISDNKITGNSRGSALWASNNTVVRDNIVEMNSDSGIYLHSTTNADIRNNTATSNAVAGIYAYDSHTNTISGNTLNSNGMGITISNSTGNNITNNNATSNTYNGITLEYSNGNTISGNTQNSNLNGIYLDNSIGNNLANNIASNNNNGIHLTYSGNNILQGNNMSGNTLNFYLWGGPLSDFIQTTIDMSNTVDGKPIYYMAGVSNTVIDASTNAGYVAVINGANVTVRDLTLKNNSHGVLILNTSASSIERVTATNNYYGIYVSASAGSSITDSRADSNIQHGIVVQGADGNSVINNTADSNGDKGIYIYNTNNNDVKNNSAASNDNGIYMTNANGSTLTNNRAGSNTLFGITLLYSNNNTVGNNIANSNDDGGINLDSSRYNTVASNIINSNNGNGIYLESSIDNIVANNTGSNNIWGIYLKSSSSNTITNNKASNNIVGIYLLSSSFNTLADNDADSNDAHGIELTESSNRNTLTNNTASDNMWGFYLSFANENTLSDNAAKYNSQWGIFLGDSSNNTIHNNHFNNYDNFNFSGAIYRNDWNTTKQAGTNIIGGPYLGGNFWAYPNGTGFGETCTDADSDGICDSSYTLASGNVDYLPLAKLVGQEFTSPSYSNVTPSNNSYTSDTGQDISIVITDEGSDVNAGSLSMNVSGDYYDTNSGKMDYDTNSGLLTYNATEGEFNGGQGVYVVVNAEDNLGNQMEVAWSFTVDTTTPTYSNLTPSNNSYTSDTGQDIAIVITDVGSDVNAGSVSMNVSGDYYDTNSGKLSYDTNSGLLTYNATEGEFNGGQGVYVVVNAEDNVGNQMEVAWSFTVDTTTPTYSNLNPPNNSYTSDTGQDIAIVITDVGSDVNAGSVSMNVSGDYYDTNSGKLDYDTNSGLLTYYASDGEFNGGQVVYVVVNAEDKLGNSMEEVTWSFTVITEYNISLIPEWNLISIPLEQDNWNITSVLATIEGNYSVVFAYIDDVWEKSTAVRDPLTEMSLEYGYWIYMTAPDTLELSGTVPSATTINIIEEWNLVGYPSFTAENITDVLSSINYSVVFAYIDDVWEKSTAVRDPLTEMSPGYGYWVYANEAGSYEVN